MEKPVLLTVDTVEPLILCGGLGTRLRGVLLDRPKTLAEVCGRPFLAYLLDQLVSAGFTRAALATGHLGQQVRSVFQDYYRGIHLRYSQESAPMGTGGAVRLAGGDAPYALVMNGDSYCDTNLALLLKEHFRQGNRNSIAVIPAHDTRRFGSIEIGADGRVAAFREKASETAGAPIPGLINAGIYILSRDLIDSIEPGRPVSIEHEVFPHNLDRLQAVRVDGKFIDIGTPESYRAATSFFGRPAGRTGAIFVDRDGTVNVEQGHLAGVAGMKLLPRAAAGLRSLMSLGMPIVVVTNQTVVARGECSIETLKSINAKMIALLKEEGALVDGVYCCPHADDEGCECRKPKTGLIENAARVFDVDLLQSFLIGDKWSDILAGAAAGATTILVRTGHGSEPIHTLKSAPDHIVSDLLEAAQCVTAINRTRNGHTLTHRAAP